MLPATALLVEYLSVVRGDHQVGAGTTGILEERLQQSVCSVDLRCVPGAIVVLGSNRFQVDGWGRVGAVGLVDVDPGKPGPGAGAYPRPGLCDCQLSALLSFLGSGKDLPALIQAACGPRRPGAHKGSGVPAGLLEDLGKGGVFCVQGVAMVVVASHAVVRRGQACQQGGVGRCGQPDGAPGVREPQAAFRQGPGVRGSNRVQVVGPPGVEGDEQDPRVGFRGLGAGEDEEQSHVGSSVLRWLTQRVPGTASRQGADTSGASA